MTEELFAPAGTTGRGVKVRCTVCGRSGYANAPWQESCRAGHPYACICGRVFSTKQGIARHLSHEAKAARQAQASGMDWPPVSDHRPLNEPSFRSTDSANRKEYPQ